MKSEIKVFIVDDDSIWCSVLKKMLNNLGYSNVLEFNSGQDCIESLYLNPRLIFLDYQMENMDGLKTLQKIKKYDPSQCVIFCTVNSDINLVIDAMKSGSEDFLLKGYATPKKLKSVIEGLHHKKAFADRIF